MNRLPAPAHRNGFTLAEVLVSLFMFALVSSLILSVVTLESRVSAGAQAGEARAAQLVAAQEVLRQRMERMRAIPEKRGLGDLVAMRGNASQITFVAPDFASEGPHALQFFRLRLSPQRDLTLYRISTLSGVDERLASTDGWSGLPLAERVDWLEIAYFGSDRFTGRDRWQAEWNERRQLPKLVRVRLGFAAGDPRRWPVLLVRPWSSARVRCSPGRSGPDCGTTT